MASTIDDRPQILYNAYNETFEEFIAACAKFFRQPRRCAKEPRSLLTNNLQIIGATKPRTENLFVSSIHAEQGWTKWIPGSRVADDVAAVLSPRQRSNLLAFGSAGQEFTLRVSADSAVGSARVCRHRDRG